MRAYVGVTDGDWYRFLASRPDLDEVNFWRPGGDREFRAVAIGEPFFFKTHHPHNRVVGGGFFSGFVGMKLSEAWDLFGPANGVDSPAQMRLRVGRYRRTMIAPDEDPRIGCVFIRNAIFFPPGDLVDAPPDFAANIVQGKGYDLADPHLAAYFRALLKRLLGLDAMTVDVSLPWHRLGPVYGDPRLVPQRLGQRAFQAVVLDAYHGRCAITGARIRPVLQAAHIRPLPEGGEHRLDNGHLMRSDVHTLYDKGYLGVDPHHRLLVSRRLRAEFDNGDQFYARAGETIALPMRRADRPGREFLEWHLDEVFKAA
jgi:putative restriction endonuclease